MERWDWVVSPLRVTASLCNTNQVSSYDGFLFSCSGGQMAQKKAGKSQNALGWKGA